MHWLRSSLTNKLAVGTAAGLLLSSLVFLVLYVGLYQRELATERSNAAEQVNRLLQTSLENAMLKRDLEGLRFIIEHLGQQPTIEKVFITNPAGEVRFASDPAMLGRHQPLVVSSTKVNTLFLSDPEGNEILRSINPVANRAACGECHGPVATQPINGVLYVDYDAAPIRSQARATTLFLMGAGATIVLLNIAGGWWFMQRFVLRPIAGLSTVSTAVSHGDLSARVNATGQDELAQLGRTFDTMAEQLQAKLAELEAHQSFLQALVDAIPDGVRVIGPDYRILLTNEAYRRQLLLGNVNETGEFCYRASHQLDAPCPASLISCPVHEIAGKEQPLKVLHRHHRKDGRVIDVEIYAAPMHATVNGRRETLVVESIRDLSKQIRFSQEQKLSEVGKLATGVAHEIHNPLASVRLGLHGLRTHTATSDTDSEIHEYLELVDREIDKCIHVTERLLRLGTPPPESPELVDVTSVIEETLSLLRWEAETCDIRIVTDLTPGLRALASDSELRMVVLNLIQNAFHAMPEGGQLSLSSRLGPDGIEIAVHDTGIGIPQERLNMIFDPFYSRRADGVRGTGLGLSITRNILENHGGRIGVESTPGEGSTFTVLLPDPATLAEEMP